MSFSPDRNKQAIEVFFSYERRKENYHPLHFNSTNYRNININMDNQKNLGLVLVFDIIIGLMQKLS